MLTLCAFAAQEAFAASIGVAWDASQDSRVTGYKVYWGTKSGNYTSNATVTATSYTLTGLTAGTTYYIAVTCTSSSEQSAYSSEVTYKVPNETTPPTDTDSDHDGLTDAQEASLGTNPNKADTDGDGISDGAEVNTYKTSPLKTDTDGDGLSDGVEVNTYKTNPLKSDTDGDGVSDGSEVQAGTDPLASPAPATSNGPSWMEYGNASVDHNWKHVTLTKQFSDPVVVAMNPTAVDPEPATVRIRNVSSTGFDIRIQEWANADSSHAKEQVGYLVVERGDHSVGKGGVRAGTFSTSSTSYKSLNYSTLPSTPVVLASVTTYNSSDPVTVRLNQVSRSGFAYRLQERESNYQYHGAETVSYVAVIPGKGVESGMSYVASSKDGMTDASAMLPVRTSGESVVLAAMQTERESDTATVRLDQTVNGACVYVCEDTTRDQETSHTGEKIGYLVIGVGGSPVGAITRLLWRGYR